MGEVKQVRTSTPRWLRVLLGVSLGLNLLVVGLAGGAMMRYGGSDGLRAPPRSVGAALFRALPGEDQRALRNRSNAMPMSNGMRMDHHARMMAEARAVSEAVRATPFDEMAVRVVLEEQAARREGVQRSLQQAWLDRVAAMSDQDRAAYAVRLEHAMSRPWSNRRKDARRGSQSR